MIKRINIGNLGLFKDLSWENITDGGGNVVDLKKENIFYGRNYSGKTTLSRIVRALESKELSSKYKNPEFEIVLSDNNTIDETNFRDSNLNIRCFNEDFIKENLRFIIDPDSGIVPFAILGGNTEIESQIQQIKAELGDNIQDNETKLYGELISLEESTSGLNSEYDSLKKQLNLQLKFKATTGSDSIKTHHSKFGDINYNIKKLERDIETVLNPNFISIDVDRESKSLQVIEQRPMNEVVLDLELTLNYDRFFEETKKSLAQPLLDAGKIQDLLANPRLNNWVKEGYELHNENRECGCQFCGSTLSHSRWEALDSHFDEQSKQLEAVLINLKERIENEIRQIESLALPERTFFYQEFQTKLEKLSAELKGQLQKYIDDLKLLIAKVENRLNNLFEVINLESRTTFQEHKIVSLRKDIHSLVLDNNKYSESLDSAILESQKVLRLLEIKRFTDRFQYSAQNNRIEEKGEEYTRSHEELENLRNSISAKELKIEELSRRLNNEEEGARKVNTYLQNYFGHQNLELQAVEEEDDLQKKIRFNIVRGSEIAYHLSEGECSIIAFCYFMAKLDDIHTAREKPIIFIDDPISSLDANHIFYVFSLINVELFQNKRFEQIFISTHNLDFLKYLKRLKLTKHHHEYFLFNRYENCSTILPMPKYLKDYVTEFNFLFEQIYRCAKAEVDTDDNYYMFYNFGNNARKFLEALLFYKYPSRIDNQTNNANSKRLLKYFGDDNHAASLTERVNNELSHLEQIFDRGMQPIDIPEIKKVAQFILDKIEENDREQFNALLESIGVENEPGSISNEIVEA